NDARSLILKSLETARFAMLVRASCTRFLAALPKGVPKMLCAVPPFMIKRTWFAVVGTTAPVVLIAFTLINWPAARLHPALNRAQASPAKMPTAVDGAPRFPRKGRAESKPKLNAARNAES